MTAPARECQPEADGPRRINGEFYAKGNRVFRAPIETKTEGGTSINIGFPVCTVSDYVDAEAVASCLEASREIDALKSRVEELTKALLTIVNEYGPNHGSRYCFQVAVDALKADRASTIPLEDRK